MEKTSKAILPKTVDEYLDRLPADQRAVLQKLREAIQAAAPRAEESISYGMAGYKFHGPLVYFAAFKNHCSLFAVSKSIMKQFEKELKPFKINKGTIQFTTDEPLPVAHVKKMVKLRVKENVEKEAGKKK